MSDYDLFGDYEPEQPATLEEEKPTRASRRMRPDAMYNVVALFFVAAAIAVCLLTLLLVQNPTIALNPFPPPTPQPTPTLFDPTAAAQAAQASGSGESVVEGEIGGTPEDDEEAGDTGPTVTPTDAPPTATPTIAPTATGAAPPPAPTNTPSTYAFTLQDETLTYIPHAGDEGCDYMAIAGQVFDVNGDPLIGMPVIVEGDEFFEGQLAFTGNAPDYGPSGYEVFINDSPYEGEFTVKLVSETGFALSEEVPVKTSDSCEQNVVIVNFVQNQPTP